MNRVALLAALFVTGPAALAQQSGGLEPGASTERSADAALPGDTRGGAVSSSGQEARLRLRSSGGVTCANEPLYVIDGVSVVLERDNPLAAIQPSDIVSIDVMKRDEAMARYGEVARNGVVLIATRHAAVDPDHVHGPSAPFPNPVQRGGLVTVPSPREGVHTIDVFDALGRRVATVPASAPSTTVPTEGLAPGVYLVRLVGDTEQTSRFTVQ